MFFHQQTRETLLELLKRNRNLLIFLFQTHITHFAPKKSHFSFSYYRNIPKKNYYYCSPWLQFPHLQNESLDPQDSVCNAVTDTFSLLFTYGVEGRALVEVCVFYGKVVKGSILKGCKKLPIP